jgi:hypothetical protein
MNMKKKPGHARVTIIAHAGTQVIELCVEGDHTLALEERVLEAMDDVIQRLESIRHSTKRFAKQKTRKRS